MTPTKYCLFLISSSVNVSTDVKQFSFLAPSCTVFPLTNIDIPTPVFAAGTSALISLNALVTAVVASEKTDVNALTILLYFDETSFQFVAITTTALTVAAAKRIMS